MTIHDVADFFGRTEPRVVERDLHALLNVRLQAQIVNGISAFATLNNLLDYRYQPEGLGATYFLRGRTFLFGFFVGQ